MIELLGLVVRGLGFALAIILITLILKLLTL